MEKLEKLGYPVSEIYEDLLGTTQLSVLNSNIHFNQVILDDRSENIDKVLESKKIAAIFFAYYEDSVDKYIPYIRNLPSKTHICLISTSNETLEASWIPDLLIHSGIQEAVFQSESLKNESVAT